MAKRTRSSWRRSLPWLAAALLGACAKPAATVDADGHVRTHVVLQTDWFAQPEHGGFYEALVKGYYREAGLDVEIRQGAPALNPEQVVATGQADFAISSSNDVMVAAGRGIPLVMVGAFMERDPQALMVHAESGVRTFKDLDGRKVMAEPGAPFIDVIQKIYGIRISITPTDFGMGRFLGDKNFVQQCFVTNEPYYVRAHGAATRVLLISDSGFSPYRVFFTRRAFIAAHPDVVRAFTAASIRGWRDYVGGDQAAANALIASLNPKLDPPFMAFSVQAMRDYHLIGGDPAAGDAPGRLDRGRVGTLLRQLASIGLLDHPLAVDDVLDDHFIPAAAPPPANP
jgi:NitT/TauT family transport system substrate-binding protein